MQRLSRLKRFDLQVRAALFLLVLFLAGLDVVNLYLLRQGRVALERSEHDRVAGMVQRASSELGSARLMEFVEDSGGDAASIELRRAAGEAGLDRLVLHDANGRVLATGGKEGEVTRLFASLPIEDGAGRAVGSLQGESAAREFGALERSFRYVLIGQAAGIVLILLLVLGFAEWVSRPYRRLAAAAGEAGLTPEATGETRDPEALVSAVRGMVAKLKEQDDALASLARKEGGGLEVAERFATSTAERMPTGVLAVDRECRVTALNPAARALLGLGAAEGAGSGLAQLPRRVLGLLEVVQRCLDTGTGRSRDVLELLSPGGRRGHVGVAVTPAIDEAGETQGVLVLLSDLTEIRWLQERARLRDGLAAVGEISAGIVHEVRNALGTILAHARVLEKRVDRDLEPPVREILREVGTVRAVLDEFLTYAKPPAPERRRFAVAEIVQQAIAGAPASVTVVAAGDFDAVFGDDALLRRAFGNLLQNAADAAAESGRSVEVRVTGARLADEGLLEILVDDDGPGIAPEALPQLFVPFFTTRASGTGLGLALVQRTIVDMGGSIEAAASPRGGALFRILLPTVDSLDPSHDRDEVTVATL